VQQVRDRVQSHKLSDERAAGQPSEPSPAQPPTQTPPPAGPEPLLTKPPQIPDSILRLLVNILVSGECSNKTFHNALALIHHISFLPGARDVIAGELGSKAQVLGDNIALSLGRLHSALISQESGPKEMLPAQIASKFSSPSADQAKLLRVLKTIEHMFDRSRQPGGRSQDNSESAATTDSERIKAIHEGFNFDAMWSQLGACLSAAEERGDMENVASMLLPLMEALMVVCKYLLDKSTLPTANVSSPVSSQNPTIPSNRASELFVSFTDQHRKVLNLMVRNNPSLMSGSFSLLVENSRVLDFDNKRNYFTQQLRRKPATRESQSTLQLNVRRARVFEDSFQVLQRKTGEQIKYGKLSVRFYDEEGVDAGGLTREWFTILARQMFNPDYALFQPCAADNMTYQPNRASSINPEHLSFFKFVGRIIGKAIFDGRLLDAYFARSLYRQLLGKPVDYRDVEWVDPEYYKSLIWILENDPTLLDLTFIVEDSEVCHSATL
jgi:E3 ubiquitin-protein ligase HUWE1